MGRRFFLSASTLLVALAVRTPATEAQADRSAPGWLLPMPEVDADPKISTLASVVGHGWGEDISSPAEIARYLRALADAAPDRARVVAYAKTAERRELSYLIVTSPANLGRIDEIRAANLRLADPRSLSGDEAKRLIESTPAIVWMAYGVHGDEISSGDAALLTAYHLICDRRPETRTMLEKVVVIIDPAQNPDGRDRFVQFHREGRGVAPDAEPLAAERVQRWASGRFNHYLFDMNRDWFLQTQAETRGKVEAYLRWQPHVTIDAHEMGANSEYYFDPPADPILELITPNQLDWIGRFGKRQAARFDAFGFAYTTREVYDAFYPGYGSTWPTLHGSIGILWEQAGARGLVVDREDGTTLRYADGVRHHYLSGLSTVETAAAGREKIVADFHAGRASAIAEGARGPIRGFLILPGPTPQRAARLATLLERNGIEVRQLRAEAKVSGRADADGVAREWVAPVGSYHVELSQPAGRLARSLLTASFDMGQPFRERQLDRRARRLGDEIYDLTAWSLPMAFGLRAIAVEGAGAIASEPVGITPVASGIDFVPAKVAYLIPPEDEAAMVALGSMLRQGFRAHVFDEPTTIAGRRFPKGTLLFRVGDNPNSLHDAIRRLGRINPPSGLAGPPLTIVGTDTGLVDEGAGLGGMNVSWVKPPRVAMVVDRPTSVFAGHTWYLFDEIWKYPLTRVGAGSVGELDLARYNVLILPDGKYPGPLGEGFAAKLKDWVKGGGTLILVRGAAAWGAEKSVGLLATKVLKKPVTPASGSTPATPPKPDRTTPPADPSAAAKIEPAKEPEREKEKDKDAEKAEEMPDPVPGAFLRASVYDDHFVTFGSPAEIAPLVNTDLALAPIGAADGRNLVTIAPKSPLVAGFCWPETLALLAGKPLVVSQASGKGHVIGFADDPNYRAMSPITQRFFLNAVFFGPGH